MKLAFGDFDLNSFLDQNFQILSDFKSKNNLNGDLNQNRDFDSKIKIMPISGYYNK